MLRMRRTAVVPKRNLLGRLIRGRLPLEYVMGMDRDELLNHLDSGWLLPILGASPTVNANQALANPVYFPKAIVVSTDQTIHQSDMVWWDGVNYTLKALTTSAQVAISATGGYCGVAAGTNVPGVYPDPAAGTPSESLPGVVVQRGGSARLNLQLNDVVDVPFASLTAAGVDAQTVSRGTASTSNRVGLAIVPTPVVARGAAGATPVSETVAGGTSIEVWLEPKFPTTALL